MVEIQPSAQTTDLPNLVCTILLHFMAFKFTIQQPGVLASLRSLSAQVKKWPKIPVCPGEKVLLILGLANINLPL